MKKTKEQKAITLVALIITIIVLLILAVVAISSVQDGGIIQYAHNARDNYIIGQQQENEILRSYLTYLEENGSETPYIVHNDTIPLNAKYITRTAEGEEVVYESTESNYVKFPETVQNGDIYIYGDYQYVYNKYYKGSTGEWVIDETQAGWGVRVRDGLKTNYGTILTTINGKDITSLRGTFYKCESLTTAPAIPSTVKIMIGTFVENKSLVTAPTIPNGVINMSSTFSKCSSLKEVPEIPNTVENMISTFNQCTSLTDAPIIPDSVKNMFQTFFKCTSLTGTIVINVTEFKEDSNYPGCYESCFYGTEKDIIITSSEGVNNKTILEMLDGTTQKSASENNITVQKD